MLRDHLELKGTVCKNYSDETKTVRIEAYGPGEVTAGDIVRMQM